MENQTAWKNKIVGYGELPADQFLANEANWRIHPKGQQDGLGGVLDVAGWVDGVKVNKRTSELWGADRGVETLIDGHLRVTLALRKDEKTPVPVTYVDLTPDEERLVLLTFDPLAGMAATDRAKMDDLLRMVQSDDERMQAALSEIAEKAGIIDAPDFKEYDETIADDIQVCRCPTCGHEHAAPKE